jgi:hypothetical protein
MIESRRILWPGDLTPILFFVEAPDASMNAEVERIGETLNIGRAMSPVVLVNANVTRVCYGHDCTSLVQVVKVLHLN